VPIDQPLGLIDFVKTFAVALNASVMRRQSRSTLKSQLIVTYITIGDPLAETHPQLRQHRPAAGAGREPPTRMAMPS
jgi:hypothetical protein